MLSSPASKHLHLPQTQRLRRVPHCDAACDAPGHEALDLLPSSLPRLRAARGGCQRPHRSWLGSTSASGADGQPLHNAGCAASSGAAPSVASAVGGPDPLGLGRRAGRLTASAAPRGPPPPRQLEVSAAPGTRPGVCGLQLNSLAKSLRAPLSDRRPPGLRTGTASSCGSCPGAGAAPPLTNAHLQRAWNSHGLSSRGSASLALRPRPGARPLAARGSAAGHASAPPAPASAPARRVPSLSTWRDGDGGALCPHPLFDRAQNFRFSDEA